MKLFKKSIIIIAVLYIFSPFLGYADYCDIKYNEYLEALKNTTKIMEPKKQKYIVMLEKAHKLCKQDKMAEASQVMEDLKDQFFNDAVFDQQAFYGH